MLTSLLPFFIVLGLYSVLSIVFAFVPPPERIASLFKVPSIFIFLPDRLVMPVGRLVVGLLGLGLIGFLIVKLAPVL